MLIHRLLLAVIVSLAALMVAAPVAHVQANVDVAVSKSHLAPDLALLGSGGSVLPGSSVQPAPTDMTQPIKPAQTRLLDTFPFSSNCFNFSGFCNTSSFGGCFNFFCRPISVTGCFSFFNFGCRTFNPSFFPFFNPFFSRFAVFNRFNFNFNNGSMVNCIQIMRMPGGGTITIRVC